MKLSLLVRLCSYSGTTCILLGNTVFLATFFLEEIMHILYFCKELKCFDLTWLFDVNRVTVKIYSCLRRLCSCEQNNFRKLKNHTERKDRNNSHKYSIFEEAASDYLLSFLVQLSSYNIITCWLRNTIFQRFTIFFLLVRIKLIFYCCKGMFQC